MPDACDPKRIVRYFYKDLAPSKRHRVKTHLDACETCQRRYRALEELHAVIVDHSDDAGEQVP